MANDTPDADRPAHSWRQERSISGAHIFDTVWHEGLSVKRGCSWLLVRHLGCPRTSIVIRAVFSSSAIHQWKS